MLVVLETLTEGSPSRKTWLRKNQRLIVGRTAQAEFIFPEDPMMSGTHFEVDCQGADCTIRDLSSRNGTTLNSQMISEAVVQNGDQVAAGRTKFVLRIVDDCESGARLQEAKRIQPTDDSRPILQADTLCRSGLTRFVAGRPEIDSVRIARRLAKFTPAHVVVDPTRFGGSLPSNLVCPLYLFGWMRSELRRHYSPVVVSQRGNQAFWEILETGWGRDCVICVYSTLEGGELSGQLEAEHPDDSAGACPGLDSLGPCRPSALRMLLSYGNLGYVDSLFSGIDVVLLEFEEAWEAYAPRELRALAPLCSG